MKINLIIFLLSFILLDCNNFEKKYKSKVINTHKLLEIDSLIFFNSDSIYIGQIKDIKYWNDYIIITDRRLKKLWIFDDQLRLKGITGREGRGPGEYIYAPFILPLKNEFVLIDYTGRKIDIYNKKKLYEKSIKYPSKFVFDPIYPIKVDKYYIFSASTDVQKKYNSIVVLDTELKPIKTLFEWEPIYQKKDPYSVYNPFVILSIGEENSFFARQQASLNISHFDKSLNLLKVFGIKPHYFKNPPQKKVDDIMRSAENTIKYVSSITKFISMEYDYTNNFLLVNYVNYSEEASYNHSDLSGEHFLQVYDANYNCVFDGKMPGKLVFVKDGIVYILAEENPDYFKIKKIKIIEAN